MKNLPLLISVAALSLINGVVSTKADTVRTLHGFLGGTTEGAQPLAGLVEGSDSNFYGTTSGGGLFLTGTVFRITSAGTLTTLHMFASGLDGAAPKAPLILAEDGNFYGTTFGGGGNSSGTVYQMTDSGTVTILHAFSGAADGGQPSAGLVQGSDGNFYGTTQGGGALGSGTVFQIMSAGTFTTLWNFNGAADGAQPMARLTQGSDGNFYGTAFAGGVNGSGTVFRVSSNGTFITLWSFFGMADGGQPAAPLVQASDGRLYGTASTGGAFGLGSVFRIASNGTFTALWNFSGSGDGANPLAGLVQAGDGNLYGTTSAGGSGGAGTIFKITPAGNLTTLYDFAGALDGANPMCELITGSASNFYGTTSTRGSGNFGTVFTLIQPCTFSISPSHVTVPATAFSGTFTLNAASTNCPWTAVSNDSWITITSVTSGEGDATIAFSVEANSDSNATARVGTISVGGKVFTITQQILVFGQFLQGTYNGLIQTNPATVAGSGSISVAFDKSGTFAAKLNLAGTRSAFRGEFDNSGNATSIVTRSKSTPLHVTLHLLAVTNGTGQLTGTVSDGVFTSDILADLAVFGRVNPCSFTGQYTFVVNPADASDTTVPQGSGYGTMTVASTGAVTLKGVLGDGSKISAKTSVSADGAVPFYEPLYKNQGTSIGWLTITASNTVEGTVDWVKPPIATDQFYPAGFTTTVTVNGALYVSPTAGGPSIAGSDTLTLGGGNLTSNLVKTVVIDAAGKVTVTPSGPDKLTLKLQPKTGAFSGSFVDPALGTKSVKFNGFLLQSDDSAAGLFFGTSRTGFVTLQPGP